MTTEISVNIEEELRKKSEEIHFLNEKLQSLKSNFLENSKNIENIPIKKPRQHIIDNNPRMKHYSLDPDFLKNNILSKAEPLEKAEDNEKNVDNMNKMLIENGNQQADQIKKLTQKLDFLSTEFEKSLKEKTQILQDQMKLLKDNSSFLKENQFLHNQNKKLLLDIESFNVATQKDKKERETLLKDLSIKTQEVDSLKKEISSITDKTNKINQTYEKLKSDNEGIMTNKSKMIESMTVEINKNAGEINDFRQKYQNLLDNKRMIEQDNDYLRDKNEDLEAQMKSLQEKFVFELEKKDIGISSIIKEYEVKDVQIKELEAIIKNMQRELNMKDVKYEKFSEKHNKFNKEYDALISENLELKRQNEKSQREINKLLREQIEFEEILNVYKKHKEEKEELIVSYTLQRNKILSEYKELHEKCELLESELKSFKLDPNTNRFQDINVTLNAMHQEIDNQMKETQDKKGECVIW